MGEGRIPLKIVDPAWHGENAQFAMWAGQRLGYDFSSPYRAIGIVDDDRTIHGVIVFNNYTDANVDMTGVGLRCWRPSIMRQLADYVFNQLKCERVTAITRQSNAVAKRVLGKHFVFETKRRRHFGNEDGLQFRMCRDECPWLEKN